ncbi:hypothetical protein C8J57DRAFT_1231153 [Mycena rebaudengoi]|nr:hypothetical protein C8J57DRAFT_1231153 [Mycena rebaudengoi]
MGVSNAVLADACSVPKPNRLHAKTSSSRDVNPGLAFSEHHYFRIKCGTHSFHYRTDPNGVTINVWEHNGDQTSRERPPGGALSKFKEEQMDLQVLRKLEASAHQLQTDDIGPGSIPLGNISLQRLLYLCGCPSSS